MSSYIIYVLVLVATVLIFSALSYFSWRNHNKSEQRRFVDKMRTQTDESGVVQFVRCPVCNIPLMKEENLVSKVFRPMTTGHQRMTVLGCPHCYPVAKPGTNRVCPVCKKPLKPNGYLIARLFNKPDKKHVIITGCTGCLKAK